MFSNSIRDWKNRMFALPLRAILAAGFALAVWTAPTHAADTTKHDDADRAHIESIVHDYLMQHPEVILQAVQALQNKEQAQKEQDSQQEIVKRSADLLHDPRAQILGNPQSDCVVVEFFDNQCPYCQANEPELQKLIKEDGRVKLVLKEFPILGPASIVAAKAALASVKQGKYAVFHAALLAHKGHYESEAVVDAVAKSVGLDMDKLHKDMEDPDITAE